MQMPRTLKIGHYRLKVTRNPQGITDGVEMEEPAASECPLDPRKRPRKVLGLCSWVDQRIYVDRTLRSSLAREILLHEVLHALWTCAGLNDGSVRLAKYEEQIVATLAPAVLDVLRRNPKLVEFLTEDD